MSTDTTIPDANGVARDQLRAFIERVERVEEEIATLNTDKSDIYKEARAVGFDVKVLRKVVAKRKLETHVREEQDAIFDMYWEALYGAPVHVHTHARENIEENRRSDNGLNIQTKHEDIRIAPETAEEQNHCDGAVAEMETGSVTVTAGETAPHSPSDDGAIAEVKGIARLANADGVEPPSSDRPADQPLTGGDHEVSSIAKREVDIDRNPNTGEGAACALPDNVELEYVPKSPAKRLPFSDCFPSHSEAEYKRLEKDIAANRVQEPIVRQGDVIIDGFARYCISRQYGMSYPVIEYSGTDVLLDVIEWQRAARNFTPAQERKIAADLAKEIPHRAEDIFAAFGHVEQPNEEEAA